MAPSFLPNEAGRVYRRAARVLAGALLTLALLVLLGWKLQNRTLTYVAPGFAAMKVNAAIAFLLCSIGLFFLASSPNSSGGRRRRSIMGVACGVAVTLIGGATLIEYSFGIDLRIDELLFHEPPSAVGSFFPGRMSDLTAFNLVCLGAALSLFFSRTSDRLAQAMVFATALGTLIAIMGQLYGFNPVHADARYTPVALHTAFGFVLSCVGILCARPDCGFVQLFTSSGVSGTMVRRLFPAATLVPLLGGWLLLIAHRRGILGAEMETLIYSAGVLLLFTGVACWNGWFLFQAEESRERIEADLRESTRRFAFLADSMPQIIWTARPDGNVDYYNKAWYEYTGLAFEQSKDLGWGPVLHPDDVAGTMASWTRSVQTGAPCELEYRFKRAADGAYRWHLGRALAMRDAGGAIKQWVGTCTDIHEQRSAKEELARHVEERTAELSVANSLLQAQIFERQRAEQRNEQILAHSLDVICTISEQGHFTQVSAAARNLWGYEPRELIGRQYYDFIHPEDHERTKAMAARIFEGDTASDFENRFIRKDGTLVTISWAANWSETEKTMFCVAHDITDRKESTEELRASEERFRSVAQSLGDAIISSDAQGQIIFWNQAAETIFGHSAVEVLGRPLSLIMPERFRERHHEGLRRHHQTGEGKVVGKTVELIGLHKDGHEFPVELSLSTWHTSEGRFYTGIVRDIAQRKKIKEELRTAKEAAEAASQAKSEFLANVSHEIRTPLNGMLGMADLALDLPLSEEARKHIGVVKTSGLSLLTLLNDLLDFSKIEAGKLNLEKISFDLRESLETKLEPLRMRAQNNGLNLLTRINPAVPRRVVGDPTRLGQVVTNLVDNAIKFTPAGTITLEIEPRPGEAEETCLQFAVSDTGIGIPENKQKVIFEAFAQADGSTTRNYGGTGLGLGICARLVEQMGGAIEVESAIGRGSKFKFTARFGQAPDEPAQPEGAAAPLTKSQPGRRRPPTGLRILVAEDNPINREVAAGMLERAGYKIALANDGHEAVSLYRRDRFDVVLMDVQMPGLDGLAATREIRKLEQKLGRSAPIIAMTAHAMPGDRERCLEAGMNNYLSKPLTKEALFAMLDSVLTLSASPVQPGPAPALVSQSDLLASFDGDSALLERLGALFAENTPGALRGLRAAAEGQDAKELARIAHGLLSSLGVFRAEAATRLALQLEEAGRRADFSKVGPQLDRLENEINRILATLADARLVAG